YFNLDSIRVTRTGSTPSPDPQIPSDTANRTFFCTFSSSPTECGFSVQQKTSGRATIVNGTGRDGSTAVRLHTEPGDTNVAGSGSNERNDLSLGTSRTDCSEGKEQWWAHSVLFPNDYTGDSS